MKDGAYFLNTSRGEVVDEASMLAALDSGKLAAAGVDVISEEQQADLRDHPVVRYAREHDNLVITPHMAGLTVDSESKTGAYAFAALRRAIGYHMEAVA
jgi:phosphoglycerate dehydrogenase-like enzyme